jgi:hypothetical protein
VSEYVFHHKEHFNIFIPDVLNTPMGKVLRHNWAKNQAMYDDTRRLIEMTREERVTEDLKVYPFQMLLDDAAFPNT